MAALGTLIIYGLYALLIIAAVLLTRLAFIAKFGRRKFLYIFLAIASFALLIFLVINQQLNHRKSELEYVGTYYLTSYPNCQSCKLILKENNSYQVISAKTIIEEGNWHYESGGDYFIVY